MFYFDNQEDMFIFDLITTTKRMYKRKYEPIFVILPLSMRLVRLNRHILSINLYGNRETAVWNILCMLIKYAFIALMAKVFLYASQYQWNRRES